MALPSSERQTLWGYSDAESPSFEDRVPTGFLALRCESAADTISNLT